MHLTWNRDSSNRRGRRNRRKGRRERRLRLEPLEVRTLLTTVSISATDNYAIEPSPGGSVAEWGEFAVSRDNPVSDLTVSFSVGGSATQSADYDLVPIGSAAGQGILQSSVTIPAGETSVTIRAWPKNLDGNPEPTETVVLTAQATSEYDVDSFPWPNTVYIYDGDDAPYVKIEAVEAAAYEPTSSTEDGHPGQFRITRYGDLGTLNALPVAYSLQGNATEGTDYDTLGTVTIPASETFVDVEIDPKYDGLTEGGENVEMTIFAPTEYDLGYPGTATVTIYDSRAPGSDAPLYSGSGCGNEADGGLSKCIPVPSGGTGYMSAANPHPIVAVDALLEPTSGIGDLVRVEAQLKLGGCESESVYYDGSSATDTDPYRFALQVDTSTLATGRYDWEMTLTQSYSNGVASKTQTYHGQKSIINAGQSQFGNRWGIKALEQLIPQEEDMLWMKEGRLTYFRGDSTYGAAHDFHPVISPTGYWTLDRDGNDFLLKGKDGTEHVFDSNGYLSSITDRNGNQTEYDYDYDAGSGSLEEIRITDPTSRMTTFVFDQDSDVYLDTITDFAGRVTTFAHGSSGQLLSITRPDPDGPTGSLPAPVISFGYDATSLKMTSITDPEDNVTGYAYDFAGTLATITYADDSTHDLRGVLPVAMIDTSSGSGTLSQPAALLVAADSFGSRNNDVDNLAEFTVDGFGQRTSTRQMSDDGSSVEYEITYERNPSGLVTRMLQPDPDGTGPRGDMETLYEYDAKGNLTELTFPDGKTNEWAYDSTFSQVTQFEDEWGHLTLYDIDSNNGNILEERQVVGVNDETSSETDDVVTTYVYTPVAADPDAPNGLLHSVTDPMGNVTTYYYDQYGQPDYTILPDPDGTDPCRVPRSTTSTTPRAAWTGRSRPPSTRPIRISRPIMLTTTSIG